MAGEETLFGKELLESMKRLINRYTQTDNETIIRNPAGKLAVKGATSGSGGVTSGTFTAGWNGAFSGSYGKQAGRYIRVGKLVQTWIDVEYTTPVSLTAPTLSIGSLPFAPVANHRFLGAAELSNFSYPTYGGKVVESVEAIIDTRITTYSNSIYFFAIGKGVMLGNVLGSALQTGFGSCRVSISYEAAS